MFEKFNESFFKKEEIHPLLKKFNQHLDTNAEKSIDHELQKQNIKLLSQYFKLDYVYLSFMDSNEVSNKIGSNEENIYFLNTNTGKVKVSSSEYLKFINIFNADFNQIPFEYVSEECGKKKVKRSYKKVEDFFNLYQSTCDNINSKKFIVPIFLYHLDLIPMNLINEISNPSKNNVSGFLLIMENYKKLNYDKIKTYKNFVQSNSSVEHFIKFGQGHPSCRFFELNYPFDLAEKGICILSNFEIPYNDIKLQNSLEKLKEYNLNNFEIKSLDLNNKIYESDTNLIKENCKCFTCENNYTRAYIHHLLKCKEMNGNILIIM